MLSPDKIITIYNNITSADYDEGGAAISDEFLPIGNSAGQNKILLKVSGNQVGSIWFWEFNNSAWGTESNTWLGYVAKDFYDFINNLRPYE